MEVTSGVVAATAGHLHTCVLIASQQHTFREAISAPAPQTGREAKWPSEGPSRGHTGREAASGGVKCWGWNAYGQLGDGTVTYSRKTPADVSGLTSGVIAVTAGYDYTCALTTVGGVKCWGDNRSGQLGDGTTISRTTPVDVIGLTSGVIAVTAGGAHTCALVTTPGHEATSGSLKCWGNNTSGQLGDGTTISRTTPVDVSSLTGGVIAMTAGEGHTCALVTTPGHEATSGSLKCWGNNTYGQLGDGTTISRTTPVDVSSLTGGVIAMTAGYDHTCALVATPDHEATSGGLECWGDNTSGQLGNGTRASRPIPGFVIGLDSPIRAVTAGGRHTCGLNAPRGHEATSGWIKCWGDNTYGQLGDSTTISHTTPVDVIGLTSGVIAMTAGEGHTCALMGPPSNALYGSSGGVKCWGDNTYGQLGDGTTTNRTTPVDVYGLNIGVIAVIAGRYHTCALMVFDRLMCWGDNRDGQLGDGTTINRTTPVDVIGLTDGGAHLTAMTAVTAGHYHTCVMITSPAYPTIFGGIKCWGDNTYGQLGDGTTISRTTPVDVNGLNSGAIAMTAGAGHTCVLTPSGGLRCWGYNASGQLGDGTTISRTTPVDVTGLTSGVIAVTAGGAHTCALTAQPLNGPSKGGPKHPFEGVSRGHGRIRAAQSQSLLRGHTPSGPYGLGHEMLSGGLQCWGDNQDGQLGDGTTTNRTTPVDVNGLNSSVIAMTAGTMHTCVLTTQFLDDRDAPDRGAGLLGAMGHGATFSRFECWGDNTYGQLGDTRQPMAQPSP